MRVKIYQDKAGEWRWTLLARNGRVIADGSEGYFHKSNARRAFNRARQGMTGPITYE